MLALTSCGAGNRDRGAGAEPAGDRSAPTGRETIAPAAGTTSYRIVAVGDVACAPGSPVTATTCQHADTARLAASLRPNAIVPLGDLQYPNGTLQEFNGSYRPTWGAMDAISRPVVGNHEYRTPGAAGYYAYTGQASPGYYAWNAGAWRIYNLNTNCSAIDCAAELRWLAADMAAHPRRCQLIASHSPRFSSGYEHGNDRGMIPFWRIAYRHRTDIALAGHDHDYERFVRLAPDGTRRPYRGIRSFVSGTGGKSLYGLGTRKRGSVFFQARRFGVLQLDLRPGGYSWRHVTTDGVVRDQGSSRCL